MLYLRGQVWRHTRDRAVVDCDAGPECRGITAARLYDARTVFCKCNPSHLTRLRSMRAHSFRMALPCLLLGVSNTTLAAQSLAFSTTAAAIQPEHSGCARAHAYGALASEAVADWALLRLAFTGALASSINGGAVQGNSLQASLASPEWRGLRAEAGAQHDNGSLICGEGSRAREYGAGFSLGANRSGVSLRYVARIKRADPFGRSAVDTTIDRVLGPTTRGLAFAAWHNVGAARIALTIASRSRWSEQRERFVRHVVGVDTIFSDSGLLLVPRSGQTYESRMQRARLHSMDSELRMTWARGLFAQDVVAGGALGVIRDGSARFWGRTETSFSLTPTIALVGAFVLDGGMESWQTSPRRYATLGFRLTSAPFDRAVDDAPHAVRAVATAFRIESDAKGTVTIAIRAPFARLLEVTGDFVQWRPVRMQRASSDWWQITMPLQRGVHRVNVRVDGGAWNAPPGLPRQRDEFGGDAGVFFVP